MKNRQLLRLSLAFFASLGVHFAAAMIMTPSAPPVLVEGGTTAEIAMLGSSFEDLLRGNDHLAPADATTAKPVAPETVNRAEPLKPAIVEHASVVKAAHAVPSVKEPLAHQSEAVPVMPDVLTGTVPVAVPRAEQVEVAKAVDTPKPTPKEVEPAKPVETASLTPSHATEIVRAEPETVPVPIARSKPPQDKRNSARTERKKAEPARVANVARGNADRNARAGISQGRADGRAKSGGSRNGGKASRAGNAQVANYPGKVYSKIKRTRQKRAGGTGVARIRFSIASSGALASIRVAASSGSSSVDNVAVDHIRRSAPFPPPPAGAQRQYVIPVEVRR